MNRANTLLAVAGFALAFSVMILFGRAEAEPQEPLHFTCNDFPPHKIEHVGSNEQRGFDIDIISEAFRRTGWSIDITYMPWKRALEFSTRDQFDGLCTCSYTPEREATLMFSDEVFAVSVGLFALDPAALAGVTGLADLKGRRVGVVGGYNLEGELETVGAKVSAASTDKRALEMLLHGNVDLLYAYELPTRHFMRTRTLIKTIEYREMRSNPYYMCLNRKSPRSEQAMADFNRALAEMKTDKTMKRILRRYRIEYPAASPSASEPVTQ
ncbi:MAG TPA: transporter substrate-binding domain-containing protein [Dongiaceae bacterium]|nr:transporter substrate-binding domain-containing protein [Dongiaceae bacterium]